ncbi:Bacteriophytochrome (light-regulated signal transduction histidine kinase) [Roseateles sp. YR242]|uniref:ATP-binding protein n=1 Tax=Roseateles sp. YR242 TaxID=1855305 RepID=UPI0008BFCFF2|nr:ATP-binding protein [Roseateles sp. YR242]SEK34561.1 Bacteriophytochrome (light-regulated signal transduction histidine kinase) [Roseateles sp. YR242]
MTHEPSIVPFPTLQSCAEEPIHIPGSIQPHGLLIALREGRVAAWSDNVPALLGIQPTLGMPWQNVSLPGTVHGELSMLADEAALTLGMPAFCEIELGGKAHDAVVHVHDHHTLIEIEPRTQPLSPLSSQARVYDRIRRAGSLEAVLQVAVDAIRTWTGFDRVMAYRFRHDDSGEVQAEAKVDTLSSYLGLRYPASDIPAQARRLYLLNTLRLIPHVSYRAVPLIGHPQAPPLDLTHSVLRSVSPIHVEYLHNMGVGASMSVSIVLNDKLWGLIACHHMSSLQVPYPVRSDCDVLANILSSAIGTIEARELARGQAQTASLIAQLAGDLTIADDAISALLAQSAGLRDVLRADAVILVQQSKVVSDAALPQDLAVAIATTPWTGDMPALRNCRGDWPEPLRHMLGQWVGAMCVPFDASNGGLLIALRKEQKETVRWAGQPDKVVARGPNGPRLTPRGSFSEWREQVADCAEPWSEMDERFGKQIMLELQRTTAARQADIEAARRNLLAMLSHDLRDPLQAIQMVAGVLKREPDPSQTGRLGARLDASSGRMHRLITQVLDFSRADVGMPLHGDLRELDMEALLHDLVEEVRMGHPGFEIVASTSGPAAVVGDPIRLAQAMSNLIANARNYGAPGRPVTLSLAPTDDGGHRFAVANEAEEIPAAMAAELFEPFKRGQDRGAHNRSGLGLGLFITRRIVEEHGGTLAYRYVHPNVIFEFTLGPPRH